MEEEREAFKSEASGCEIIDLELWSGREGMLSIPVAELHLMDASASSHHSGVVGDNERVEEGEYEQEAGGREDTEELMETK